MKRELKWAGGGLAAIVLAGSLVSLPFLPLRIVGIALMAVVALVVWTRYCFI